MFVTLSSSKAAIEAVWSAVARSPVLDPSPGPGRRLTTIAAGGKYIVLAGAAAQSGDGTVLAVTATDLTSRAPLLSLDGAVRRDGTLVTRAQRFLACDRTDRCAVIVDRCSGEAVMAAARMGLPELFQTAVDDGTVIVSTDLSALLAGRRSLQPAPTVDPEYFAYFLTGLPENEFVPRLWRTPYRGISALPPGHLLALDRGEAKPVRYWRYWGNDDLPLRESLDAVEDEFRAAVARRCSSTRTAVALSGGTDSACVAAAANAASGRPPVCYLNFSKSSILADERREAEAIAEALGARLSALPSDHQWARCQTPQPRVQVEPHQGWFGAQDRSLAPSAKADGADVVLDGIGGDELFGLPLRNPFVSESDLGLTPMSELTVARLIRRQRTSLWHPVIGVGDVTPSFLSNHFISSTGLRARIGEIGTTVSASALEPGAAHRLFCFAFTGSPLSDCTWLRREIFSPLGIRRLHPYRDSELVTTVFRVPLRAMASATVWKPMLGRLFARLLPTSVPRQLKGDYSELFFRGFLTKNIELVRDVRHESLAAQLSWVDQDELRRCLPAA